MTEEQGKNSKKKLPSAATRMVWYVTEQEETQLFLHQHDTPHALVDGEALPISGCNNYLRRVFYDREREAVANDACLSARGTLTMLARDSGGRHKLQKRAFYQEGGVFYQIGPGRVLKID